MTHIEIHSITGHLIRAVAINLPRTTPAITAARVRRIYSRRYKMTVTVRVLTH